MAGQGLWTSPRSVADAAQPRAGRHEVGGGAEGLTHEHGLWRVWMPIGEWQADVDGPEPSERRRFP